VLPILGEEEHLTLHIPFSFPSSLSFFFFDLPFAYTYAFVLYTLKDSVSYFHGTTLPHSYSIEKECWSVMIMS